MHVEQLPFAIMEDVVVGRGEEFVVEVPESLVFGPVAPSAEMNRQTIRSSFELSLIEKTESRQRADDDGGRSHALAERRGAARFVVVFDEPRRTPLVIGVSHQVSANIGG